jgi:hypothetical protein
MADIAFICAVIPFIPFITAKVALELIRVYLRSFAAKIAVIALLWLIH